MGLGGIILGASVTLILPIGLIVAVVALFRRASDRTVAEPGIGVLKRLYYYAPSLVALGVAASGVVLLLRGLLEAVAGERVLAGGETQLALALALTLVGVPVWLYLWSLAQRSTREFPAEAGALIRKLYVYFVLGVAAAVAAGSLTVLIGALLGVDDFNLGQLALPIVASGVWALHWRGETREGQPTETARLARRLYVYLTSAYALVMAGVGAAMVLTAALTAAYDALAGSAVISPGDSGWWSRESREGAALAAVGGAWWAWHWLRVARRDGPSDLRHIYLYGFAALAGATTFLVTLNVTMGEFLLWALDAPAPVGSALAEGRYQHAATAAAHFRYLPGSFTGLVLGGGVWGYHAALIHQEPGVFAGGLAASRRVYRYLLTAIGLVTLAIGTTLLLGTAVGALTPQPAATLTGEEWRESFAWGVPLALTGGLLWGYYWRALQQIAAARPDGEPVSQSRRAYLYGAAGAAVLMALGSLSALLFVLLRDLLEGELALQALHESKWSIGVLLVAGAAGVYHWLILREERGADGEAARPAAPPRPKDVVVLAADEDPARRLEARLGYSVRLWRAGGLAGESGIADAELDLAAERIAGAPGDRVVVIAEAGAVRVLPYEA